MDDDDLRRGKPSCHKEFDEATALLVGDALQSLAFAVLTAPGLHSNPHQQLQMTHLLAQASGSRGMAGGQAIDLDSVGLALTQEQLEFMHLRKTGALIRAAVLLGAWCSAKHTHADADNSALFSTPAFSALDHYAKHIGLAFQVIDDILDSEADTATLGKTSGKDKETNKPTYVTILGVTRARKLAAELHANAIKPLAGLDNAGLNNSTRLIQIADYIMQRAY
jgi:farnesyl diphosphate synthase